MTLHSLNKTKKNTLSMGLKISEPSQQIKTYLYSWKKKTYFRPYNKHHILFYKFQLRSYHYYYLCLDLKLWRYGFDRLKKNTSSVLKCL